jgi:ABC-type sugar transport system permease subunit
VIERSGPSAESDISTRVPVLQRQLRDFGVGAIAAIIIATIAFVAVRNTELASRQIGLARRAASAIATNQAPVPTVTSALVTPSIASKKHAYLHQRQIRESTAPAWRALVADASYPLNKLFYDAANRSDQLRTGSHDGAYAELLRDGTGRAIAAVRACGPNQNAACNVALAITSPARPAPFPFLVIIGVLGLGAALAAAGALVSRGAARVGVFAGIAALAVPTMLWHAWIATTAILLIAAAIALAQRAMLTDRIATSFHEHRSAFAFLAPAGVSMLVLVAAPFVIGLFMGFYDHKAGTWTFAGLSNFLEILSGGGRELDDPLNFWFTLGVTVLWTLANITLHVTIGVCLALVLSKKWLFGKGIFRMLLILPWAIPNYITALMWKGMFEKQFGAINGILDAAGLDGVSWFTTWANSFGPNVATNTWLGFPFMMIVAIGALETIPKELYEAASVDGASKWQQFRHITLPHLRPALGPAVALGSIWTFNMFNVIFLVSGGKPNNSTNILVTDAYRWAFERGERYGMAAAYGTVIFLILLLWTVFGTRIVRRKEAA